MNDERELERRFRAAIGRVGVPEAPLRAAGSGRADTLRGGLALTGAAALVVTLLVVFQALSGYRAEPVASMPTAGLSPLRAVIQREEALAFVRGLDREIGRVDRAEAKLLTWEEYLRIAGPARIWPGNPQDTGIQGMYGITGDPSERVIWAVAVSGQIWPAGRVPVWWGGPPPVPSPTPYPPYQSAIFVVDAVRGELMTIATASASQTWPAAFDALVDHPASAYIAPTSGAPLAALGARVRSAEATRRGGADRCCAASRSN